MVTVADDWLGGIAERLSGEVGFEDDQMSVRTAGAAGGESCADGVELVAAGGTVERLRRVKDEARAGGDRRRRRAGRRRLALEPRARAWRAAASARSPAPRRRGSASWAASPPSRRSSPPGPNGALPHAEPGEREIGRGELVVFDMGAKLDGYCSDGTRTFATGEPGEEARGGLRDGARGPGGGARRGRGRGRRGGGRRASPAS